MDRQLDNRKFLSVVKKITKSMKAISDMILKEKRVKKKGVKLPV